MRTRGWRSQTPPQITSWPPHHLHLVRDDVRAPRSRSDPRRLRHAAARPLVQPIEKSDPPPRSRTARSPGGAACGRCRDWAEEAAAHAEIFRAKRISSMASSIDASAAWPRRRGDRGTGGSSRRASGCTRAGGGGEPGLGDRAREQPEARIEEGRVMPSDPCRGMRAWGSKPPGRPSTYFMGRRTPFPCGADAR